MSIYTSYFANIRNIPEEFAKVSICLSPPKDLIIFNFDKLAPKTISNKVDEETHSRQYRSDVLGKLNARKVVQELELKYPGQDIVLLCYEKPPDYCHRHIIAEWLKKYGIDVKELPNTVAKKVEKPSPALSMFQ